MTVPVAETPPPKAKKTHIVVFYTTAGGGHVAAARALRDIMEATGRYRVTLVNPYKDLVPHLDLWRRLTGRTSEDIYNQDIIREGRTGLYCLAYYLGVLVNFRLVHRAARDAITAWLETQCPDMVVSVVPMSNRIIFDAVKAYKERAVERSHVNSVVLITDWTEYGRHIWFPRGGDYFAICGTEDAYRRAGSYKSLANRVFRTQGLLLRPAFGDGPPEDKASAKKALGLAPDRPVICMLYGAHGGWRMQQIALAVLKAKLDAQLICLCGHNEDLATALEGTDWPIPVHVVRFTQDMPRYLGASDIFVGKPGPGGVSEALDFGLYLLLDKSMALPQEKPVLTWVRESGRGTWFRSDKDFPQALKTLLRQMDAGDERPQPMRNTASSELPGILERIRHFDKITH